MHTKTALLFQGHPLTVGLAARELYTLQPDDEVCLACVSGSLWVTLDHDLRDIILEPGQSWTMPARRRCVMYALQPSHARMTATTVEARRPRNGNTMTSCNQPEPSNDPHHHSL